MWRIQCSQGGISRFVNHLFPSQDDVCLGVELGGNRCFSASAALVLPDERFLGFGWCLAKKKIIFAVGFEPTLPEKIATEPQRLTTLGHPDLLFSRHFF